MRISTDLENKLHQLEKENRVLRRKLDRSERTCDELEATNEKKESLLRTVIRELRESQASVEERQTAIQALKAAQAQLIQTEKMSSLGQLVAGVAHEINNPVNFIWGNLQYAERYLTDLKSVIEQYQKVVSKLPPDLAFLSELEVSLAELDLNFILEDFADVLQSMQCGADRILQIVQSLKNFSHLDEQGHKEVDIHEGINNTLLILQHRLNATDQRPEIQVQKNYAMLPLMDCYPDQLNQVFMNLLTNAIDACEESNQQDSFAEITATPNKIQIHTQQLTDDRIQIAIADNGVGIPSTVRDRLFDPFFTTKEVGKGTGLGLAISYQIITNHHQGTLNFQSEVGQGTTFIIELPIHHQGEL